MVHYICQFVPKNNVIYVGLIILEGDTKVPTGKLVIQLYESTYFWKKQSRPN